jgi:hypothetical protein
VAEQEAKFSRASQNSRRPAIFLVLAALGAFGGKVPIEVYWLLYIIILLGSSKHFHCQVNRLVQKYGSWWSFVLAPACLEGIISRTDKSMFKYNYLIPNSTGKERLQSRAGCFCWR